MIVPIAHLILFTSDLERGCDAVEHHLGTRPVTEGPAPRLVATIETAQGPVHL